MQPRCPAPFGPLAALIRCAVRGLAFSLLLVPSALTERTTVHLDGPWQIADSASATELPTAFLHTVPVPGLVNLAEPPFPDVDAFFSREHLANRIRAGLAPAEWLTQYWQGKVNQDRNYFWYRKTFRAPPRRTTAQLRINKAQFGTAVWLNDQKLGEYSGCFSASHFPLESALRWDADNTLVIRIGAHPAVLPDTFPTGSDFEKIKWTPGIYDRVSLVYCDGPVIQSVQVAPRLATSEILIQTVLENRGPATRVALEQRVLTWKDREPAGHLPPLEASLAAGETHTFTQRLPLAHPRLWSPENPFLYMLESRTAGDHLTTRFGFRDFRFDAATGRAHLNGQPYYLRGSNITLHRFFEDPLCRDLPWNETWVRRLLGELPRQMHWNYFRFCIGPVPDQWFDICDELGLLIQNEFFVWTGGPGWYPGYSRTHDPEEMIRQYRDWMRDHWNHPSVAVWDANNETKDDLFATRLIPAVRPLDLSDRPWENSYNPPAGPHDPVEYHPYLMQSGHRGKLTFRMADLETMDGRPRPGALPAEGHPVVINEYGWLWLNRDGSPTVLTENVYAQLLGPQASDRERLDLYAYLLAAKTEFWRAHRHYAGIIHFVYLTCSYPGVSTADHFTDVPRLTLEPAFADYVGEAFKPLGVYLNFFQPALTAGTTRTFEVFLVNDEARAQSGHLTLVLTSPSGETLARAEAPFALDALGQSRRSLQLTVPAPIPGRCLLQAVASPTAAGSSSPTTSRRWVSLVPPS